MSDHLKLIDPVEDPAMRELFKFVGEWAKRHNLKSPEEAKYLSHLLAGRLDVAVCLAKLREANQVHDEASEQR